MARLVAVLAILGALSAPGAWAQAVEVDEGFMDLTLPDLSPAAVDPDGTYVDPQIRNRGECLDHPGRPAWVMVQPKGLEWRRDLLKAYGELQIAKAVVESGDCGCDNRYPDWETFRPAMEGILALIDQKPVQQMTEEEFTEILVTTGVIKRRKTEISREFGRTCRGTR